MNGGIRGGIKIGSLQNDYCPGNRTLVIILDNALMTAVCASKANGKSRVKNLTVFFVASVAH